MAAVYMEVPGDFRRDTQKRQNVKQRSPLGLGIRNHRLLSIQEGSVCYKPLAHRASTHLLLGVSGARFHGDVSCPVAGQETVARKPMWCRGGSADGAKEDGVGIEGSWDSILSLSK